VKGRGGSGREVRRGRGRKVASMGYVMYKLVLLLLKREEGVEGR
jgi:hypothetical protein